jgi:hypothetical protein
LQAEVDEIDRALERLGLVRHSEVLSIPNQDSRFARLMEVIGQHLLIKKERRGAKNWRPDERLIIFTEYKTTLDYLHGRLKHEFAENNEERIRVLYGGRTLAGQLNR